MADELFQVTAIGIRRQCDTQVHGRQRARGAGARPPDPSIREEHRAPHAVLLNMTRHALDTRAPGGAALSIPKPAEGDVVHNGGEQVNRGMHHIAAVEHRSVYLRSAMLPLTST